MDEATSSTVIKELWSSVHHVSKVNSLKQLLENKFAQDSLRKGIAA